MNTLLSVTKGLTILSNYADNINIDGPSHVYAYQYYIYIEMDSEVSEIHAAELLEMGWRLECEGMYWIKYI